MNILAFDTCLAMCSAAVGIGVGGVGARVISRAEPMVQGHAERLMPMIAEVLDEAGLAVGDLDRIAVANGPGTFTGTRIAVSAARALALAAGCPVVAISSLELVAQDPAIAVPSAISTLAVLMDAHRSEVYAQIFDASSRAPLGPPALLSVEAAAASLSAIPLLAVGSGAPLVGASAASAGRQIETACPEILPEARNSIVLATSALPLADPLRPLYLRPPDARPQDGKSLPRAK